MGSAVQLTDPPNAVLAVAVGLLVFDIVVTIGLLVQRRRLPVLVRRSQGPREVDAPNRVVAPEVRAIATRVSPTANREPQATRPMRDEGAKHRPHAVPAPPPDLRRDADRLATTPELIYDPVDWER